VNTALDAWASEYWCGEAVRLMLGGEELAPIVAQQATIEQHRHGSRARLARSIRGVRHLDFPDATMLRSPRLVFSGDGYTTYPRGLESVRWQDFTGAHPLRDFSRRPGQKNKPIAFYSRTVRDLVNCESRLERSFVLVADYDPRVVHIGAQSVAIQFPPGDELRRHTVDFVVLALGRVPVAVDVKTPSAAAKPEAIARHKRVRTILAQAGIGHVVWTGHDRAVIENLAFLAASEVPIPVTDAVRVRVLQNSRNGVTAGQLATEIAPWVGEGPATSGRSVHPRSFALVVIRSLLWNRHLTTDLAIPFSQASRVFAA
jgi:hypothetical protein